MTTQQKLTHEKYQDVLGILWQKLYSKQEINMQSFISQHRVSTNLWTVLVNQGVIKKTDIGYEWLGSYPDDTITSQVIQGIRNYKSTKKDKNKCRVTSEKTKIKYKKVLNDLYFLLQYTGDISIDKFCSEKQIGKSLSGVLQKLNILKYYANGWVWTGSKPDSQMVNDIFEFRKKAKETEKSKNPFTVKEQEIVDLLTEAHNKYIELKEMHPDDITAWKSGIHKCQNVLRGRVVIRDYPDVFYSE